MWSDMARYIDGCMDRHTNIKIDKSNKSVANSYK